MDTLYQTILLDHYRNPRNSAVLEHYTASAQEFNPLCGDSVAVQLFCQNGQVKAIGVQAKGCVISIAAGSLLSELVLNESIAAVCAFDENKVRTVVGIALGPTRLKCALLALHAIQRACKAA